MRFQLPLIYPITDTRLAGVSHARQIELFADGGARIAQLRDKTASGAAFYRDACDAVTAAHARGMKLLINDRLDIAIAAGADGVHLGQDDLPPAEARRIFGPRAIIGYSTHTLEQAIAAASLPIDYVAIGPVFETFTKEDPYQVVGIELLRAVRSALPDTSIVAIGGLNEHNLADTIAAGADSAAVISAIFVGRDIAERTRSLITIVG